LRYTQRTLYFVSFELTGNYCLLSMLQNKLFKPSRFLLLPLLASILFLAGCRAKEKTKERAKCVRCADVDFKCSGRAYVGTANSAWRFNNCIYKKEEQKKLARLKQLSDAYDSHAAGETLTP
jgi:hypothetical protein